MAEAARTNKDRLFRFLFGREETKAWTLSLYNAVNGSSYTDPDDITITTVMDAIYMSMKNDLSFLVADTMNFYEQQSSYNPNMPMRFLIYAGMVYSRYIEAAGNRINIYSSTQQRFPAPRLLCFYNGTKKAGDREVLRLQDAFPEGSEADIRVDVTMLNVNYGRNKELMEACAPLRDYAFLVDQIRSRTAGGDDIDRAVEAAIDSLPDSSVIKPALLENKAEVKRMCITEYNEERTMNLFREEFLEEGRKEGREEERASSIRNVMASLKTSADKAMDILGIPAGERKNYIAML